MGAFDVAVEARRRWRDPTNREWDSKEGRDDYEYD